MTDQFSEFEFVNGVADAAVLLELTTSNRESKTARFKRESDEIDRAANNANYSRLPQSPTLKLNSNRLYEKQYETKSRQRKSQSQVAEFAQELQLELENVEAEMETEMEMEKQENPVEILENVNIEDLKIPTPIPECPNSHSEGRTLVNTVFPTDVDSLFTWIFTDSKFFNDLHKSRKTFDMLQSDWPEVPEGTQNTRKITFTITLNQSVGPRTSCITETQVMHAASRPGQIYVVDVDSVNAKPTPYADSFSIFSHFCMTRISANETKLVVVNQIKYMKSVSFVVKPFIEKNSWAGLEDFYTCLEKALKLECSKMSMSRTSGSGLKKLTLNSSAHIRLRRMNADANGRRKPKISRTKRPAPEPPTPSPNSTPSRRQRFFFSFSQKSGSGSSGISMNMKHVRNALLVVILALICLNIFLYLKLQRLENMRDSSQFQSMSSFDQGHEIKDERAAFQWLTEKLEKAEMNYREQVDKWKKAIENTAQSFHKWDEEQKNLELDLTNYAKDEGKLSRWMDWD